MFKGRSHGILNTIISTSSGGDDRGREPWNQGSGHLGSLGSLIESMEQTVVRSTRPDGHRG